MIEVFADISCPYAHVGLTRFVHQRWAAERPDLVLRVRAWPLELVNGEPLSPRHVAEQVDDLRRQVARYQFRGFDPETFPRTTLPALELVDDAYAASATIGELASLAVRHLSFERGEDVSDPRVLDRLRRELSIGPPKAEARSHVLADWQEGRARGVVGSPHFFVDGNSFFCPSLKIERLDHHRRIRVDADRFDDFFRRCTAA